MRTITCLYKGNRRTRRQLLHSSFLPGLALFAVALFAGTAAAQTSSVDWSGVQAALRFQGMTSGNQLTVNFLDQESITVNGTSIPPAMVLEGYVAFQASGTGSGTPQALVFGEFPVREEKIEAFKTALVQAGVDISALHNHVIQETPRFKFFHIEAFGNAQTIATAVRAALDATGKNFKDITNENDTSIAGFSQVKSSMPSDAKVLGREGVIDVELDRKESYTSCEPAISSLNSTSSSGLNGDLNAAAFTACRNGTGQTTVEPSDVAFSDINVDWQNGSGEVDADLSLLENEVNPAIKSLEQNGYKITALHNHALTVRPELLFLHMSNQGDVVKALQALRAVWNATGGRTGAK